MKDVYEYADKVLILDAELLNITLPDGAMWDVTECLLRLCSSNWWRRLWTLQEGVKAREIYFQFYNRCISLRHIFDEIVSRKIDSHVKKIHLRIVANMWENIRWNGYKPIERREPIRLIWNAVQFRVPSKISDETICLGSQLGFGPMDMQILLSIPGIEPKRRMQRFLLLQHHFPVDILFVPGRKFIDKPFRWAPTSFIFRGRSDDDIDVLGTDLSPMDGPLCTVDMNGIHVFLAGFVLDLMRASLYVMFSGFATMRGNGAKFTSARNPTRSLGATWRRIDRDGRSFCSGRRDTRRARVAFWSI